MRRILAVAALTALQVTAASGPAAASRKVTVTIKGGRPTCAVDRHRARLCAHRYRLRPGHTIAVRIRGARRGHAASARRRRSLITIAGGRPICSVNRHRAHACRRRYRLRPAQTLTLRARVARSRKPRPTGGAGSSGPGSPPGQPAQQPLDGCPAMPTNGNVSSAGHTWTLEGQDDFTKAAPIGSFASGGSNPVYAGDHGMAWSEYADGATSTYSNGSIGYEPKVVQSVHDGVLDWYLHNYNGTPVSANPSPFPAGHQYQTYGRFSFCEKIVPADANRLDDFYQAIMLWPANDGDYQSAESDFPEGHLSDTSFSAFAHYGGSGSQDAFATPAIDTTGWHVFTQEWGPGFRSYYVDGNLVGTSTQQVTSLPERWQFQVEPSGSNDGDTGHVYVGWAVIWGY